MITIIDIEDSRWDTIVQSYGKYDVYYLSYYVKAFQLLNKANGVPVLVYYTNGDEFAYNVLFKRDVALTKWFRDKIPVNTCFDLITPYGYGGFIGNINDYEQLEREYSEYCVREHYICEFVRFELFSNYYKHYTGNVENRTHNIVRSLDMPIDEIWNDVKYKVRKNVKKAINCGVEIIRDEENKYLDDFLRIYYKTMDRTEAHDEYYFSVEFFKTILSLRDNSMLFHVLYEGKIISTELVIYGSENCYSYLGGTDSNYFEVRPNDFLKYEIIKWAKEKNLRNFVLGGGYGADDGIFQYKQSFAPNGVVDWHIGSKIHDIEMYNKFVEIRSQQDATFDKTSNFFPLYRS